MALDDASAMVALLDSAAYCRARRDVLDPKTVDYQQYHIADITVGKALDSLIAQHDPLIRSDRAHACTNLDAFEEWHRETGWTQMVSLPEREESKT
jgi:hypothetical protein